MGTATATGESQVDASSLDSIPAIQAAHIDLLKVDVDGFDGEVLAGAAQLLQRCQPAVIFEWHPKLAMDAGNNPFVAFKVLADSGYQRYLWFTNSGPFSHFTGVCSHDVLEHQRDYLLAIHARSGEHFDIVALPKHSQLDEIELAALEFART